MIIQYESYKRTVRFFGGQTLADLVMFILVLSLFYIEEDTQLKASQ